MNTNRDLQSSILRVVQNWFILVSQKISWDFWICFLSESLLYYRSKSETLKQEIGCWFHAHLCEAWKTSSGHSHSHTDYRLLNMGSLGISTNSLTKGAPTEGSKGSSKHSPINKKVSWSTEQKVAFYLDFSYSEVKHTLVSLFWAESLATVRSLQVIFKWNDKFPVGNNTEVQKGGFTSLESPHKLFKRHLLQTSGFCSTALQRDDWWHVIVLVI